MDSSTDFEKFYNEALAPELPGLRAACRQADRWHLVIVLAGLAGFTSFIGFYAEWFSGEMAWVLFIFFAVLLVFAVFKYAKQNDRFIAAFKAGVIKKIINHLAPGLVYKPDKVVSSAAYKASSLYRYRYDYFDSDDYIEGQINGVSFHCAELNVSSDYAGNNQVSVFKGLFFVAAIHSRFTGGTYVWQRNRAQLAASVMDEDYRLLPMPPVVNIPFDDAEFTECFRVCSTAPEQANQICTPVMRSNMLRISRALKGHVSFSFVAGRCFVAVPIAADLLEPSAYDPGDKIEIGKYFNSIGIITNMFKQLDISALQ